MPVEISYRGGYEWTLEDGEKYDIKTDGGKLFDVSVFDTNGEVVLELFNVDLEYIYCSKPEPKNTTPVPGKSKRRFFQSWFH